ncbi:MAG: TetR/AcrR family transcriptional regulator, partial [Acidobacteria bacterium]|nr:TetR/AcrR family transcriptional regulator [Acidobacteriota bacterium]
EMLREIVEETAGTKTAETAARAFALLVEGAIVTAVMEQSSRPADVAKEAALALVAKTKRK